MAFTGNSQISDKELLCQFVVPFVNSKSSDEAVRFYKEYYAEKEDQQAFREEVVKNFYDLLRDMLQVAIMSHQGRKVPDEVVSDWNWLWREEKEPLLQNYIII